MKFLIAGLGSIGRRHLRNLLALDEQDILLYRSHQSTLPDAELEGFPVETDLEAALAHRPDAVIISNPTSLHLDVAIPAAEAGCHILLEKPVSHSNERLDELESVASRSGSRILVGFQFRFHPSLLQILTWLKEGEIGRSLSVRAVYAEYLPGMHPWEDYRRSYSSREDLGGGVILTLCHPLDYLRWLLGEVREVWCLTGQINDFGLSVEDTAEIGLRFENSVIGSVHLDFNRQPAAHHLEIVGTRGSIRWDNAGGTASLYRASEQGELDGWESFPPPLGFDRNDMFLSEMRHFLAVVRGDQQPLCTLQDGRRALDLALAAHRSQSSRQIVELPN
jgi:predicted dehydrogenase